MPPAAIRKLGPVAVVLATLALAACGSDAGRATDAGSTGSTSGAGALAFSAPVVGGGQLEGTTLEGRPVAFWFWAPT